MEDEAFIDWKGRPIDRRKHGGTKATYFIHMLLVATNFSFSPMVNMVTYLHERMHVEIASSATIVTNFIGATSAFALFGAFLSDSYISRFKTILIFGPFEFLGYALLALQAHSPSLQPPKCDTANEWKRCEKMANLNAFILYLSLYTLALGEGCLRSCMAPLGGDQFDDRDPIESRQKSSFFNWFTFDISLGSFLGLIFVVWIQSDKGWDFGFGISALAVLFGMIAFASGFSFYRNQRPKGSPLTRILQVFVIAFKKRKLILPESADELHQLDIKEERLGIEVLPHTKGLKFMDKAAIIHNNMSGVWSLSTVNQVEETKILVRMLPIFLSSIACYICVPLLITFTIQQGNTMNTKFGKIHFPPASLMIIPVTFQLIFLILYESFVPLARKFTGYKNGITQLQRIAVGFISISIAAGIAALVEKKRKNSVEINGLPDSSEQIPISVFWLVAQYIMIGISDVTSFVGLLEFFIEEASMGMKSMGTAFFFCALGLASLLASSVVSIVNKATRHGEDGKGWLDGATLNDSHLDRFYWLLSAIGILGFLNFIYWARKYKYRHDPHVARFN